jgi:hypothetical protein
MRRRPNAPFDEHEQFVSVIVGAVSIPHEPAFTGKVRYGNRTYDFPDLFS